MNGSRTHWLSPLAILAPAIIAGLRVTEDTKLRGTLIIFWYHFPSTLEKLRKLSTKASTVCLPTSAAFFAELFPCLNIFATALPASPIILTGVATVFPSLRGTVFNHWVIFPIISFIKINIHYYNYFLVFVKYIVRYIKYCCNCIYRLNIYIFL